MVNLKISAVNVFCIRAISTFLIAALPFAYEPRPLQAGEPSVFAVDSHSKEKFHNTNDVLQVLVPGMRTQEIVAKLGTNYSVTSAGDDIEVWTYKFSPPRYNQHMDVLVAGARLRIERNCMAGCVFVFKGMPKNLNPLER